MHDDRRDAPRYPTSATVSGRQPATPFTAQVANLSRTGCKLRVNGPAVPLGSTVILHLRERLQVTGQVVWDKSGFVGVRFHRALPDDVVAEVAGIPLPESEGEWIAA